MITVQDIVELPVFERIWLACPCEGYESRPVINCGTLDYEPFFDSYEVFIPGECIFTTLGFAQADPDLAEEALLTLIGRNVAAITIKPVALKEVTEPVAKASAASGVPILFYEGKYMERIITEAMNLIDHDRESSKQSALIGSLLEPSDGAHVRNTIFQIANATGGALQCIALTAADDDEAAQRALKGALAEVLSEYAQRFPDVEGCSTGSYKGTLMGFISFSRKPQTVITIDEANLARLVEQLGDVRCGISQEMPLEEGDLAIRQALAALRTARIEQAQAMRWSQLRLDAFHAAASTDRLFARTAQHIFDLLDEHDRLHGSNLHETAEAYALSFGDMKETAELLYQHPNTVRYRIKKIKEATGCSFLSDRELTLVLMMARIAQGRL